MVVTMIDGRGRLNMFVSLSSRVSDKGLMKFFGKVTCQYSDGLGGTY